MELSTYFRINQGGTGQFERCYWWLMKKTRSYLEGCTRSSHWMKTNCTQRFVGPIAMDRAEIKYSTVQNWYPGNKEGKGGVYNFVTKRGLWRKTKISLDASRNRFGGNLDPNILHVC